MSVCLYVRMEQFGSHWKNYYEILYLNISREFVEKIQVSSLNYPALLVGQLRLHTHTQNM